MRQQDRYDVVVVGGGPAGSTAAALLAKEGFQVCLLEKSLFPRPKLCAGLVTLKTLRLLEKLFGVSRDTLILKGIIAHHCPNYSIWNTHKEIAKGSSGFISHFVERDHYDHFWANQASQSGVRILTGETLVSLDVLEKKILTDKGTSLFGKWIIGGDGVFSRIRHALAKRGFLPGNWGVGLAPALETRIPRDRGNRFLDSPVLHFGFNRWGYAWSFPGKKTQTLGMCGLNRKNKTSLQSCFRRFLGFYGISDPDDCKIRGWALPYGNYLSKPGWKSILLCGDAAGFADPILGEGIYYAHKSAQLAALAIMETQNRWDSTAARYAGLLAGSLLIEMRHAKFIRDILFSVTKAFDYRVLGFLMNRFSKYAQETIQGKRTFRWLRTIHTE